MNARRRRRLADLGFFALLCLFALLTWAGLAYHAQRMQDQVRDARVQIAQRDVRHLSAYIGQLLQNIDLSLKALLDGGHPHRSPSEWNDHLDYALRNAPYLRSISLIGDDGRVVASTTPDNVGIAPDLTDYQPHTRTASGILRIGTAHAGRDLADGVALVHARTSMPDLGFIPVMRGLTPGEGGSFTVLATLNMDYLLRILDDFHAAPGDRIALLRQDGARLLDTVAVDDEQFRVERTLVERWQAGEFSGTYDGKGEARLLASWMLHTRLPIAVAALTDLDQVLAGARAESSRQTIIVLPLVLLGIVGVLAGYLLFRRAGLHERALRRRTEARQRLLESALKASASAVVITGTDATIEWVNPAFAALTGFDAAEAIGRKPKELVRSGLQTPAYYEALWNTILKGEVWRGELVNRRKDGSLYDEALTITPIRNLSGEIEHFVAIKDDITARKAAQVALEGAHARLQSVVDRFPGGIVMDDAEGRITLVNAKVFELFDIPPSADHDVGRSIHALTNVAAAQTTDPAGFIARLEALRAMGSPCYGEEIRLSGGRWLERDFVPIRSASRLLGYLRSYRDISPRKARELELNHLASTDPLTGALNRRTFMNRVARELARIHRYHRPGVVVMLDLDHFKRVNDAFGHAAGDLVLKHFVTVVSSTLREPDSLGRLGGEEFAILLPETTATHAVELCERIRARVEEARVELDDGHQLAVTVSIGLSAFDVSDSDAEKVIARADVGLYQAKHKGRNRVERAETT